MNKLSTAFLTVFLAVFSYPCYISAEKPLPHPSLLSSIFTDGFDFPVGNKDAKGTYTSADGKEHSGWYIATKFNEDYVLGIHTGEDWNGTGGGDSDLRQPVYAIGKGTVIFAEESSKPWGKIVVLEHYFLENAKLRKVYSLYAHLDKIIIKKGAILERRQQIGTIGKGSGGNSFPAHLHLEIRSPAMDSYPPDYWPSSNGKDHKWVSSYYYDPTKFISARRTLTVPSLEEQVVVVSKNKKQMYLFEKCKLKKTYEIALSQAPLGHKEKQGDNKLPEGEYKILEKIKGPFDSKKDPIKAYLGSAWLRINYPNNFDAENGFQKRLISRKELEKIIKLNDEGKMPLKNTKLGGGIGIHGWLEKDWSNDGKRSLTWGCISMHNKELLNFYDLVKLNTKILILP